MLKKIWRLFLGLVVLTGSACVTPTHASSAASVVVTHVQATGLAGAKDEMVALYNNSLEGVDITNWCLFNKSGGAFVCFTSEGASQGYYLPAHSSAIVATSLFLESMQRLADGVTKLFEPAASSGGSIVNSGDTITLVDADEELVDEVSWEEGIGTGKVAVRNTVTEDPLVYETDEGEVTWSNLSLEPLQVPENQVELYTLPPTDEPSDDSGGDDESESEGEGSTEGEGEGGTDGEVEASAPPAHPTITELLPNPEGSDTGNEFIELRNNSSETISLEKYRVRVGPQLERVYDFPADSALAPGEYKAFSNSQIRFTLLNSQSSVQLEYEGELVGGLIVYEKPPSGQAWALIGQAWQYTNTPTPAHENSASLNVEAKSEAKSSTSSLKPCAANQYRHPETNRCRLLTASSNEPTPCKEGQERNPETNRCRTILKMTNADHAVKGAVTTQEPVNWYLWLGIIGVVVLIVGYGIWEWRVEIKKIATSAWHTFARTKR